MYTFPVQTWRYLLAIQTTYTNARANLAKLCDEVTENREIVIISRRGAEDVALVAAAELASLTETAHLLKSPKNAARLLKALDRARAGTEKPQTPAELRRDLGLGEEQ
jgi:antitoxin YefM